MAEKKIKQPLSSEKKKLYVLGGLLGLLAIMGFWNFWPESKPAPPPAPPTDGRVRNSELAAQRNEPEGSGAAAVDEEGFGPVAELPVDIVPVVGVAGGRNIFSYPPPPPPPREKVIIPPQPPPPTINVGSISPTTIVAGTPKPLTVTVTGAKFQPDFQILWDGRPLQTEVVSETVLRATLSPSDIASPRAVSVEVRSASQREQLWSRKLTFQLQPSPDPGETFVFTGRIGGQAVVTFKDTTKRPRIVGPGDTINGRVPWKVIAVNDTRLELLDTQNEIRKSLTLAPKSTS
jgi:hypothetical protein